MRKSNGLALALLAASLLYTTPALGWSITIDLPPEVRKQIPDLGPRRSLDIKRGRPAEPRERRDDDFVGGSAREIRSIGGSETTIVDGPASRATNEIGRIGR